MLIFLVVPVGGESKFDYIYNKYKKLLMFKANNILNDYSLAEDAVSEAFLRVYKNLHKINDPDSGETTSFLIIIVRNTSINILNKNKYTYTSDISMSEENDLQDSYDLEENIVSETITEGMLQVVDKLNEELKNCFLLMYAYDLSYKEIGKILNISENNVAVRIHRAKKKLTELLRKENYI